MMNSVQMLSEAYLPEKVKMFCASGVKKSTVMDTYTRARNFK